MTLKDKSCALQACLANPLTPWPPLSHPVYYKKLIKAMHDYSRFSCNTTNPHAFRIQFILNMLTQFPGSLYNDNDTARFKCSQFKLFVARYAATFYSRFYKPSHMPLLYSIVCLRIADSCKKLGFANDQIQMRPESVKRLIDAVSYYIKYAHSESGEQSELSTLLMSRLETSRISMLIAQTLNCITAMCVDLCYQVHSKSPGFDMKLSVCRENTKLAIDEMFRWYIDGHSNYSIYDGNGDGLCVAGFVFVCDMVRRMMTDLDARRKGRFQYQKRYRYLLRLALRSWSKFQDTRTEKYGLYLVYLGYYHAEFYEGGDIVKSLRTARKHLYRGLHIIRKVGEFKQSLIEVYIYLIWIETALSEFDGNIQCLKWNIEFDKHYKWTHELERDQLELQEVLETQANCRTMNISQRQYDDFAVHYWKTRLKHRPHRRIAFTATRHEFNTWFRYFKDSRSYRVMRNILALKQCNYSHCRAKDIQLRKCSRCKSVFYCSTAHQKRDWKAMHSKQCTEHDKRDPSLTLFDHRCC